MGKKEKPHTRQEITELTRGMAKWDKLGEQTSTSGGKRPGPRVFWRKKRFKRELLGIQEERGIRRNPGKAQPKQPDRSLHRNNL